MHGITTKLDAACLASKIILENGGETYRAEDTAEKMCAGFGIEKTDVLALPTGITLTIQTEEGESLTRIVRVQKRNINLDKIDRCNAISRKVAAKQMDAEEAIEKLEKIRTAPGIRQIWLLFACALSSGSFTVMLGGDFKGFWISALCGLFTQFLLPVLANVHVPNVLSGMIASFCSTLFTLTFTLFIPDLLIEPIISGAIMPILPGLALTNAIRDTIRGDLVSGGARTVDAALCAILLGAGVAIMMAIWGGFAI